MPAECAVLSLLILELAWRETGSWFGGLNEKVQKREAD